MDWGIVSTGRIARAFASQLPTSRTGRLVAVASRAAEPAQRFAQRFEVANVHSSYEALLADPAVQAVYIATPHPMHAVWAIAAAEAGKHVLCEKPLTVNAAEADAVIDAAVRNGVCLMEAFMYRCHPQTQRLVDLIRAGAVGEVCVIEAVHSFRGPDAPDSRLLSRELGGGGILDVGCYAVSGARLVVAAAMGTDSVEPRSVRGHAHVGATGVDEWAVGTLAFEAGIVAHLSCGVRVDQPPVLRVSGTEGQIAVSEPWLPGVRAPAVIEVNGERIEVEGDRGLYAYQADVLADAAAAGRTQAAFPAPTHADTLANMRALDRWRRAARVDHPSDDLPVPVRGSLAKTATLPTAPVDGVAKPVSRVVCGTWNGYAPETPAAAFVLFDAFVQAGGNAFDTAFIYGDGMMEDLFGRWHTSRGMRGEVVLIAKGAHTPHCDPDSITRQLERSLERLRTDHADIYLMHRDNPDVPVAEFVDVLNQHHRAGRIGAFGGSNWTSDRIDEANAYAAAEGLRGFTVVSNQFSLARMITPTYPGCVGANTPGFRAWLLRTGTPNFAWSSQAAGFFAGLQPDGFLAFAWYDDDNLERRRRATELAERLGTTPTTVALAWVLRQPEQIHALVGPRWLNELRTSLDAVELPLTDEDVAWLDLGGARR